MNLPRTCLIIFICLSSTLLLSQNANSPNIVIIITDDQGYGDLGITGNPHVKTPVIDQLARESIRFNNFYVSPVCAPTRSSLMTGRYSLRTGIRDTYNGGAIMSSSEITIAEMLQQANYNTGIFGKWHLGDNYPSRPMDQGFDESVIHLSGGMGQVGDVTTYFQKDSSYFDPILWHNGQQEKYNGYCSDIFTEQAIDFIEANREQPFFCYLSFNAPHTPLQVPQTYYDRYRNIDPASGFDDERPFPKMNDKNKEDARKVYAMVSNIDDNVGKLLAKLETLHIRKNTLVIFMTDNGPQQARYVAGMRGRKGSVFRGGVRVPFFMSYPKFANKEPIETTTAHIDILPTLAQLCHIETPKYAQLDGRSLLPLINDRQAAWPERSLFFYWTRRYPELYNNIALLKGKYKLVGQQSYDADILDFELFDIQSDPYEQSNIVKENKSLALALKKELDHTYYELINSKNLLNPPLIEIGNEQENPIILNRNDAGGERGIWAQEEIYGKWNVKINPGTYDIRYKFIRPVNGQGTLLLETGNMVNRKTYKLNKETDMLEMKNITLPAMDGDVIPTYFVGQKRIFPFWVEFEKVK